MRPSADVARRAAVHAALGDATRLTIVEDLGVSDRSPSELVARHRVPGNLLAHHLDVLEAAGVTERVVSTGDRRRRYVRLRADAPVPGLAPAPPAGTVLFVCTRNSARSQIAAALWVKLVGGPASSAGTHPADRVHPGALAAARRAGFGFRPRRPRALDAVEEEPELIVTVCDQAHEELGGDAWWHWSTPDPAEDGRPGAFDHAVGELRRRIARFAA